MEDQDKRDNKIEDDDISIACGKERWERERKILLDGKQWCMEEISQREKKLNEMRIEMIKIESKMQRELISISEEKETLCQNLNRVNELLAEKEQALTQLREKLQQVIEERATNLNEVDAELRARERLANVYKASLDAANDEISFLKESENQLKSKLQQAEIAVTNLNAELRMVNADREKESAEKDETIRALKVEINLANTILKADARSHYDTVSAYSSVAASAANRLGTGTTTSSLLYADYGRIKEELEQTIQGKQQLEQYVRELLEEVEKKAPQFIEQAEHCKCLAEEVTQLRFQNELLDNERQQLQNCRDAASRELKYTKADLDRYLAENKRLSLQVSRLLFAIENNSSNARLSANPGEGYCLFNNIQELQKQNIDLRDRLQQLESEPHHNCAIQTSFQSSGQCLPKLELAVQELTAERDKYKSFYEKLKSIESTKREEKLSLDETQKDLTHWKARAEFLQEKLDCFNEEKRKVQNSLNERIDQQLEQIGQHRITNGRLESALEFQKNNQQLLHKRVMLLENDLKNSNESAVKATVRVQLLQEKIEELAGQLLHHQEKKAMFEQAAAEEPALAVELDELKNVSEAQREKINQLMSVNEELGGGLDVAEKNVHQLQQQVKDLEERLKQEDQAKSEIRLSAAAVETSFDEFVKKSEAEKKDLTAKFLAAVEEVQQFKLTVEQNAALLKQTKTLAIKFRNSNINLDKENASLREDIEKLNKEVASSSSGKPGDIRQLLQERIQEALKITGEKRDLTIKLSELLKEKEAMSANLCKLKTDLEEANANSGHLDTITAAFEESQKQIETLHETLCSRDREIAELRRLLDCNSSSVAADSVGFVSRKRHVMISEFELAAASDTSELPVDTNVPKRVKTDDGKEDLGLPLVKHEPLDSNAVSLDVTLFEFEPAAVSVSSELPVDSNVSKPVKTDDGHEDLGPLLMKDEPLDSDAGDIVTTTDGYVPVDSGLKSSLHGSDVKDKVEQDNLNSPLDNGLFGYSIVENSFNDDNDSVGTAAVPVDSNVSKPVKTDDGHEDLEPLLMKDEPLDSDAGDIVTTTDGYVPVDSGLKSSLHGSDVKDKVEQDNLNSPLDDGLIGYSIVDNSFNDDNDSVGTAAVVSEDSYILDMVDDASSSISQEYEVNSGDEDEETRDSGSSVETTEQSNFGSNPPSPPKNNSP